MGPEGAPPTSLSTLQASPSPSRRFSRLSEPGQAGQRPGGDSRLAGAHLLCTLPRGGVRSLTLLQHRWETPPQGPRRDRCGWVAGSLPHPHRPPARAAEPSLAASPGRRHSHGSLGLGPRIQARVPSPQQGGVGAGEGGRCGGPTQVGSRCFDSSAGNWGSGSLQTRKLRPSASPHPPQQPHRARSRPRGQRAGSVSLWRGLGPLRSGGVPPRDPSWGRCLEPPISPTQAEWP